MNFLSQSDSITSPWEVSGTHWLVAMEDSQFNLNCSEFTEEQLKVANLIAGVTASVCGVFVTIIFLFLLCQKSYSSTLQRLFLYLLVDTVVVEIVFTCILEHQYEYKGQEQVCVWLAFFTHWASSVTFFATFGITVYLLCLVTLQIRGNNTSTCFMKVARLKYSKCATEALLGFLPVILAFVLAWLPYIDGDYGIAGPWCWVRFVDENCKDIGLKNQMIYYGMYDVEGMIAIIASLIFAVVYCRLSTEFREARRLLRQTLILMLFQFVYIFSVLSQTSIRLYTGLAHHSIYAFWIIYAVVSPSRQLLFPVGYLVCFYPIKSMLSNFLFRRRNKYGHIHKNHNENFDITRVATVRESTRVSPLSHTYFIVPHESHTEESRFSIGPTKSTATGYQSIVQRDN